MGEFHFESGESSAGQNRICQVRKAKRQSFQLMSLMSWVFRSISSLGKGMVYLSLERVHYGWWSIVSARRPMRFIFYNTNRQSFQDLNWYQRWSFFGCWVKCLSLFASYFCYKGSKCRGLQLRTAERLTRFLRVFIMIKLIIAPSD